MDNRIFWWIVALLVVAGLIGIFIKYFDGKPAATPLSQTPVERLASALEPGAARG